MCGIQSGVDSAPHFVCLISSAEKRDYQQLSQSDKKALPHLAHPLLLQLLWPIRHHDMQIRVGLTALFVLAVVYCSVSSLDLSSL